MTEPIQTAILKTIVRHDLIRPNDTVIIGVSGGPDSVCLLHVLADLRAKLAITLIAAHLNHGIRGSEADQDMEYVRSTCGELGVEFNGAYADVPGIAAAERISLETAGRNARYAFFRELAARKGAQSVAVAHNRNDRAETVLMNLIRGCGPEGLEGIAYRNGDIIRPLLDTDRKDVETYCEANGLRPRIDRTNGENIHTRNKIRNEIIPLIDTIPGADITRAVLRLAGIMAEDNGCLADLAGEAADRLLFRDEDGSVIVDSAGFRKLHGAIAARTARLAIRAVKGDLSDIEEHHVSKTVNQIIKGRTGSLIELPGGITVVKSYGKAILQTASEIIDDPEETEDPFIPLEPGALQTLRDLTVRSSVLPSDEIPAAELSGRSGSDLTQYFNLERIGEDAVFRHRLPGDRFRTLGGPGSKKLSDSFIDRKVPAALRDRTYLLARGNDIIWIIGYNINDDYKVDGLTAQVLKLEVEKK